MILAALLGLGLFAGALWAVPLELGAIRAYRSYVSPLAGRFATCRYEPTCSAYALTALEQDGFWRGNAKIAVRLLRCSPLGLLLGS